MSVSVTDYLDLQYFINKSVSAAFPDLALKQEWWGKRVGTVESWRRHYRTLARRDDNKPDLLKIKIPLDLILYFSPPGFFISMPHGILFKLCVGVLSIEILCSSDSVFFSPDFEYGFKKNYRMHLNLLYDSFNSKL